MPLILAGGLGKRSAPPGLPIRNRFHSIAELDRRTCGDPSSPWCKSVTPAVPSLRGVLERARERSLDLDHLLRLVLGDKGQDCFRAGLRINSEPRVRCARNYRACRRFGQAIQETLVKVAADGGSVFSTHH